MTAERHDLGLRVEAVFEQAREADRGTHGLGEEARVREQRAIAHAHASGEMRRAESEERVQYRGDASAVRRFRVERGTVLLPRAIQQRDETVIEDVEELGERAVACGSCAP